MKGDNDCIAVPCNEPATHTVSMKVPNHEEPQEFRYCLEHAMHFAAWLPYCYPDAFELVGIQPPASELFGR